MDHYRTLHHALASLTHPAALGAALLLLFNHYVLQNYFPSWWSGKLGDVVGLVVLPLVTAVILAAIIPRGRVREEQLIQLALWLTGLSFAACKTITAVNSLAHQVWRNLTGLPLKLALDPTDLVALCGLVLAWWVWDHTRAWSLKPNAALARGLALVFAASTLLADSPAPDMGINCLTVEGTDIVAASYYGFIHATYVSHDGGLTWAETQAQSDSTCTARQHYDDWTLTDPDNPNVRYLFVKGLAVERTEDGGQTWKRDLDLENGGDSKPMAVDAIVYRPNGGLIITAATKGVVIRASDGKWQWVAVGQYNK